MLWAGILSVSRGTSNSMAAFIGAVSSKNLLFTCPVYRRQLPLDCTPHPFAVCTVLGPGLGTHAAGFHAPSRPHARALCLWVVHARAVGVPPQYIVIVGCGLHRTLQVCQDACLCTGWCRRVVLVTSTGVVRGKGVAGMQGHSPQARPLHALLRFVLAEGG